MTTSDEEGSASQAARRRSSAPEGAARTEVAPGAGLQGLAEMMTISAALEARGIKHGGHYGMIVVLRMLEGLGDVGMVALVSYTRLPRRVVDDMLQGLEWLGLVHWARQEGAAELFSLTEAGQDLLNAARTAAEKGVRP